MYVCVCVCAYKPNAIFCNMSRMFEVIDTYFE